MAFTGEGSGFLILPKTGLACSASRRGVRHLLTPTPIYQNLKTYKRLRESAAIICHEMMGSNCLCSARSLRRHLVTVFSIITLSLWLFVRKPKILTTASCSLSDEVREWTGKCFFHSAFPIGALKFVKANHLLPIPSLLAPPRPRPTVLLRHAHRVSSRSLRRAVTPSLHCHTRLRTWMLGAER